MKVFAILSAAAAFVQAQELCPAPIIVKVVSIFLGSGENCTRETSYDLPYFEAPPDAIAETVCTNAACLKAFEEIKGAIAGAPVGCSAPVGVPSKLMSEIDAVCTKYATHCSALETDVDYLENDVGNAMSVNANGCCPICTSTSGCRAFTWSDHNGGTCWLKSGKGETATKANVFSGVINDNVTPPTTTAPPTPAPSTCPTIEEGVDYVGLDVASAPSTTAEGCCSICSSDARCNAFSWTNYSGGTCWLKATKGETTSTVGTRSAVIRPACLDIEENIDYTGFDLASKPSVAAAKAEHCCGICKTTSGCKAYTWTNYNGGTCWLKSGRGVKATRAGARSASVL